MCAASAVTDYYRLNKWPLPEYESMTLPTWVPDPDWKVLPAKAVNEHPLTPVAPISITLQEWVEYQELKRRMEEYDAATGQPDCIKPEVDTWEKIVQQIVIDTDPDAKEYFRSNYLKENEDGKVKPAVKFGGIDMVEFKRQKEQVQQLAVQGIAERLEQVKALLNEVQEISEVSNVEVDVDSLGYLLEDIGSGHWTCDRDSSSC